ncbi:MAG TPA: TlpA disulfide reductase family protein, partial [Planctomycetota bacterium]|nr:TlpA disulfide reductase family protein [Planctomycetota bacterium]
MTFWKRVALATLLVFGFGAPLHVRAALAQDKGGEKGGMKGDQDGDDDEDRPGGELQEMQDGLEKAAEQLEAKDWDAAIKTYDGLVAKVQKSKLPDNAKNQVLQLAHYNSACAWSLKGEKEKALASFEKALDAGFEDWDHIVEDTDLDNIRKEPRFAAAVKSHKEKGAAAEAAKLEEAKAEFVAGISKEGMLIDGKAFDFDLTTFDGQPLKLADLKGKVVLVDMWGTWCPPCRQEIPHLVELNDELGPKGFTVVGLNWERTGPTESKVAVPKFMKEHKLDYPCALIDNNFTDRYGIEAFPTLFFIDKNGKLRLKQRGYTDGALLKAAAEKLLAEPGPAPAPGGEKKG